MDQITIILVFLFVLNLGIWINIKLLKCIAKELREIVKDD